jgi:hypothetical protein
VFFAVCHLKLFAADGSRICAFFSGIRVAGRVRLSYREVVLAVFLPAAFVAFLGALVNS